jgi:hypothetical protein
MAVTVLRWIAAAIAALLALGALASLGLYIAFEIPLWLERARRLRTWVWLLGLFWFNCEVWGRVLFTLAHWAR